MNVTWVAGACTLAVASFVFGLTGFGIGLVALSLLPVPPATVVPSAIGVTAGICLFDRIDQVRFRRLLFALLFVLGLAMCVRG